MLDGSKMARAYGELALEFEHTRVCGILLRVVQGKGFGFLEPDGQTGQVVFVHMNDVMPRVRSEEFDHMAGLRFSFIYCDPE